MNRLLGMSLVLVLVLIAGSVRAETSTAPREVTGLEWLEFSSRERTECLARSMYVLEKAGVELSMEPLDYYDELHRWIRQHPADYDSGLTLLLAGRVYEREPGQRKALQKMGYKP